MATDIGKFAVRILNSELKKHPDEQESRSTRAKYTIGSAILVGERFVLTCAHVVNAALDRSEAEADCPGAEDLLLLDFLAAEHNPELHYAKVVKDKWFPPCDEIAPPSLEDVALLELESPVNFEAKEMRCVGWSDAEYLNRAFLAIGFSEEEGIWIDGYCKGRNTAGLIQLDSSKHDITSGCSGGPVFDRASSQLIGMMVSERRTEEDKHKTAYMISVERLKPVLPSAPAADSLVKQLSKIIDRVRHLEQLEESLLNSAASSPHQCFLFEFIDADMPEHFAKRVQFHPYLERYHPRNGFGKPISIIDMPQGMPGEVFKDKLESSLGSDINAWLQQQDSLRKVVYTSIELEKGISRYIESISEFLAEIKSDPSAPQLLVLVGASHGAPTGFWAKRKKAATLKEIENLGVVRLEPLPEICSRELVDWLKKLPFNIVTQFDRDQLIKEFRRILPTGTQKRYLDIQDEVETLLTQCVVNK